MRLQHDALARQAPTVALAHADVYSVDVGGDVELEFVRALASAKVLGHLIGHLERSGAQFLGAVMPRVAVKVDEIGAGCDLDVRHDALEVLAVGMIPVTHPHAKAIVHRAVPTGQQVTFLILIAVFGGA